MSTGVDQELKAAFETASDFVQPRLGLADLARGGARRQRRRLVITAAAATTAVLLVAAFSSYLAAALRQPPPAARPSRSWHAITPLTSAPYQLAANGRYLYVLGGGGPPFQLTAYDRATGRLVRSVTVPAAPSALAVGPGGFVWLCFYPDQYGGPTGIWRLSPDLRLRSAEAGTQASSIVPASRISAWVVTQYGLVTVRMPAPGKAGRGTAHVDRDTSVGPSHQTAPGVWAGLVNDAVVAQVTNAWGINSHLVIAGQPGITFGGGPTTQVIPGAITGNSIWVKTQPRPSGSATVTYGPVVRVNDRLRPDTPPSIKANSILAHTSSLWAGGNTVWAATVLGGHALVCFAAGSRTGPVTTLMHSGSVAAIASVGDTVYVGVQTDDNGLAGTVLRYRVPAACR